MTRKPLLALFGLTALVLLVAASGGEVVHPEVTPVSGPSWLDHLGVTLERTRMGKMGGEAPGESTGSAEPTPEVDRTDQQGSLRSLIGRVFEAFRRGEGKERGGAAMNEPFTISGGDLYRLDCRACHGPDGRGAPPEIRSLVEVRGTSRTFLQERTRKLGRSLREDMLSQLTRQAEDAIRERLQKGGERMPPFRHLEGAEVDSLLMYLKQLAGLPPSEWHPVPVTESVARVGEHLVKGTCHVCHGATGPGSGHMMMMMRGTIPSLESFPAQVPPWMVARKVREGMGGMGGMMGYRSRMPVLSYVTEPEVLAAYLYLESFPPQP